MPKRRSAKMTFLTSAAARAGGRSPALANSISVPNRASFMGRGGYSPPGLRRRVRDLADDAPHVLAQVVVLRGRRFFVRDRLGRVWRGLDLTLRRGPIE